MDNLEEIVRSFTEEDKKSFRFFVNRQKPLQKRKDLQLFEYINSGTPLNTITEYRQNKNAYHTLRKRLFQHLMEYVVSKKLQHDTTEAAGTMGLYAMGMHLIAAKKFVAGWKYLKKAEKKAWNYEQYDLLLTIFNSQIEYIETNDAIDIYALMQRRSHCKKLLAREEQINLANAIIKQKLRESRLEGRVIELKETISGLLDRFNLKESIHTSPRLFCKLITIMRSAVVAQKDYLSFQHFLLDHFAELEKHVVFTKKDAYYILQIHYIITHTYYRNKHFKAAEKHLKVFENEMLRFKKGYFQLFFPRFLLLKGGILTYSGKINEAIALFRKELKTPTIKLESTDLTNLHLNLTIYLFIEKKYEQAYETFLTIYHTDKWCENNMGKEWAVKKHLVEVILHTELENDDLALNRIRMLQSHFKDFFQQPLYRRVGVFINLIKTYIMDRNVVTTPAFAEKVEKSFTWVPNQEEDIQAMSFYAWLKAKMLQQDYYETINELTRL